MRHIHNRLSVLERDTILFDRTFRNEAERQKAVKKLDDSLRIIRAGMFAEIAPVLAMSQERLEEIFSDEDGHDEVMRLPDSVPPVVRALIFDFYNGWESVAHPHRPFPKPHGIEARFSDIIEELDRRFTYWGLRLPVSMGPAIVPSATPIIEILDSLAEICTALPPYKPLRFIVGQLRLLDMIDAEIICADDVELVPHNYPPGEVA